MMMLKTLTAAAITAGTLLAAGPAQAAVVTFADYSAIGTGSNIRWVNNGTNGANGSGGSFFTIGSQSSTVPGTTKVSFSFLQASISPFVTDVVADFTLLGSVTNTPALLSSGFLVQSGIAGSFSFVTTSAITINSTTYAAGSNLLSGTFNTSSISGNRNASSGAYASSTTGGATITYTSDFLSFDPTSSFDFALSLTSITSVLQAIPTSGVPNRALRSFRANSTGSFSADPAPIVTAIPEPAVWGLMIVGFGMVGLQTRRRSRSASVIA